MRPQKHHRDTPSLAPQTFILDNGAYNLKAGFSVPNPQPSDCRLIPNVIAKSRDRRVYVASQLHKCSDFGDMQFRRPHENGYVLNWAEQKAIWDHSFFDAGADVAVTPGDANLVLTEAPNCPASLQVQTDQIVFEEYGFATYVRCIGPQLNAFNDIPALFAKQEGPFAKQEDAPPTTTTTTRQPAECVLLIDTSYSHTTLTPLLHGRPIHPAIRRSTIGGRLLTNSLKAHSTSLELSDETHAVTAMKESLCYVAVNPSFSASLDASWRLGPQNGRPVDPDIVVDWVLPDYAHTATGYRIPHPPHLPLKERRLETGEEVMAVSNARFQVPELLFNPSDIGLREAGLPDLVLQSLAQIPHALWPGFLANVVVVGGSARFPGLRERLEAELRVRAPAEMEVRVAVPKEPEKATWVGGARMAADGELMKKIVVTKSEYDEFGHTVGHAWTSRQFVARGNKLAELYV